MCRGGDVWGVWLCLWEHIVLTGKSGRRDRRTGEKSRADGVLCSVCIQIFPKYGAFFLYPQHARSLDAGVRTARIIALKIGQGSSAALSHGQSSSLCGAAPNAPPSIYRESNS